MNHESKNLASKLKGGGHAPPRPSLANIAHAWLGSAIAIGLLAWLTETTHTLLIMGSFGASCVLVFGFPRFPLAQPRNVIGGHLLASFIGLLFLKLCGPTWWSLALALASLVALMLYTRTAHPPGGANVLIVMTTQPGWDFLLTPTLVGAVTLVLVALMINNLGHERSYPAYWIG